MKSAPPNCRATATGGGDVDPQEIPRNVRLEDIMRPPVHVTPDTPAREALKILVDNTMPSVPVVDTEGYLVGFVSDGHLLASVLP